MSNSEDQAHWNTILRLCSLWLSGKKKKEDINIKHCLILLLNSLEKDVMQSHCSD